MDSLSLLKVHLIHKNIVDHFPYNQVIELMLQNTV